MKKGLLFLAFLFFGVTESYAKQDFEIQITEPPPNQLTVADLWQLSLTAFIDEPLPVFFSGIVTEETQGIILEASSGQIIIEPADGPVSKMLTGRDVEPIDIISVDSRYEEVVLRTGGAPAGMYQYCVQARHGETGEELAEDCIEVMVDPAVPPEITFPMDGDALMEPYPVFVWTEATPATLDYAVRVFRVMDGQSPDEAISANPVWFEAFGIQEQMLQYPVDAEKFEQGMYVVQVLGASGKFVLTESEPVVFTVAIPDPDPADDDRVLTWLAPAPGEETDDLYFAWSDADFPDAPADDGPYYEFRIVPVQEGQTAEAAIQENTPFVLIQELRDQFVALDADDYIIKQESLAAGLSRFDADGNVMAEAEGLLFTYTGETTAPCDTIDVMGEISAGLGALRDDICDDKHDLMDQLLDALSDYQDKQWAADALQGELDAAESFKDNLEQFGDHAVDQLQGELDKLGDLADDCGTDWEQDFHDRYVDNPQVGGTREGKQAHYDRAVEVMSRRFQRDLDARTAQVEDQLQQVSEHYDSLMDTLNDIIAQKESEHEDAQQEADDALANVQDFFDQIKDNLCGLDSQWDALFSYMIELFVCMDCEDVRMQVPSEIQDMEDCLIDLFNRLSDWKANIRQPGDQEQLRNEANEQFNADEAMDQLNELKDLMQEIQDARDDFNDSNDMIEIIDEICKDLHSYASGGHSFGRIQNVRVSGSQTYGASGGIVRFGYKPDGQYAPDDRTKAQARRDRNDFIRDQRDNNRRLNQLLGRLSRGFDGRGAENGFADEGNIEAHGKAAAVPHHQASTDALNNLIDSMLDELKDCYDVRKHNRHRTRFHQLTHDCTEFQDALRELDEAYEEHAGETADEEAYLRSRLARLEQLIERLRGNAAGASGAVEDLEEQIEELRRRMQELEREQVHGDLSDEKERILEELRQRLSELEDEYEKAAETAAEIEALLRRIEQLIQEIREAVRRYGDITRPRPITDADDAREEKEKIEDEREDKHEEGRGIDEKMNELDDLIDEAGRKSTEADIRAGNGSVEGNRIRSLIDWHLNRLRAMTEAILESEHHRRLLDCLRLLDEYRSRHDDEPGPFQIWWEFFWQSQEDLSEVPEGYLDKIDKINEMLGRLKEIRDQISDVLDLLNGINTDDPEAREKAFGKLLEMTADWGGRVPGFGDMMNFYAKAYNAAIEAIHQIASDRRRPAEDSVNAFIVKCEPDDWKGKSLEDIIDDLWEEFKGDDIHYAPIKALNARERATMEEYFREHMATKIMECCLEYVLQ